MTLDDVKQHFVQQVRDVMYVQTYGAKQVIDGVETFDVRSMASDEGDFSEVLRLTADGKLEIKPDFSLRQVNRTYLEPGSIKAWHVHALQNEFWYVPPMHRVTVGLWDLREGSSTAGVTQKLVLGAGGKSLLYIPKGVAHGSCVNGSTAAHMWYFVDQQFNAQDPDELRVPWDAKGAEFWKPERD